MLRRGQKQVHHAITAADPSELSPRRPAPRPTKLSQAQASAVRISTPRVEKMPPPTIPPTAIAQVWLKPSFFRDRSSISTLCPPTALKAWRISGGVVRDLLLKKSSLTRPPSSLRNGEVFGKNLL